MSVDRFGEIMNKFTSAAKVVFGLVSVILVACRSPLWPFVRLLRRRYDETYQFNRIAFGD
jgi:hypothetical protein